MALVKLVSPSGEVEDVDELEAPGKLDFGYRRATAQDSEAAKEAAGLDAPVAAGAAGFLRPLTLGASDLAVTALGIAPPEKLAALEHYNPTATAVGEGLGTAAGILMPGLSEVSGAGMAAKLGHATEHAAAGVLGKSLLGRLGTKAVAGAVEGIPYGLGSAVSESTLGETDLTAEKLVHSMGMSAVLGLGGGAIAGVLEEAAKPAIKGLGSLLEGSGSKLQEFADTQTLKAMGFMKKEFKGAAFRGSEHDIAEAVRAAGILDGAPSVATIAERLETKTSELGKHLGDIIDTADTKALPLISGPELAAKIEKEVAEPLRAGNVGDRAVAERISKEADLIASKGDLGFRQTEEIKRSFDKYLKFGGEQGPVQEALKDVRRLVKRQVETSLTAVGDAVSPGLGADFMETKRVFGLLSDASEAANARLPALHANMTMGLTSHITGAAVGSMTGGPLGLVTGLGAALAQKVVREKAPVLIAKALTAISRSETLVSLSKHFARAFTDIDPRLFGVFGHTVAHAVAKSPEEGLATHMALSATEPEYRKLAAMAGFPSDTPEDTQANIARAHGLGSVKTAVDEHDKALADAVEGVVSGRRQEHRASPLSRQDFGSKGMRQSNADAFRVRAGEVAKLAADPSALAARVGNNIAGLGHHAPGVAAAVSATAGRAVAYLSSKSPDHSSHAPLAAKWEPSHTEIASFARRLEAIEHPMSVLRRAADGTLTPEAMEAFRAVYPRLAVHVASVVVDKIAGKAGTVSRKQRIMLSMLTGTDLDGTMNPGAILANQAAIQGPSSKSPEGQTAIRPTSKGASAITLSSRLRTPMQSSTERGNA